MIKNIIIVILFASLSFGGYFVDKTIDALKATIATLHIKHKNDILKTKMKERGKRLLAAIPVAGVLAVGWFEKNEYEEWKLENPDGTLEEYTSEIKQVAAEVASEVASSYCEDYEEYCVHIRGAMGEL